MEACCYLEVDVNGEEIFLVDKKIIASFSGRFFKLLGKVRGRTGKLKVIFHDFPGGAYGFELMARFCYGNGRTDWITRTPSNTVLSNCVAHFMEMGSNGSEAPNLVDQTEKLLEGMAHWTWSEILAALKQCQDLLPTSGSLTVEKLLDCLAGRLALPIEIASPYTSSSENSSFQFSSDLGSIDSMRNNCYQPTWWFEDLTFLNVDLIDMVIRMIVPQKLDHSTICKFLIFYQKSRFPNATPAEKDKITEVIIDLLSLLDKSSLSCKGLFDVLRLASRLKISTQNKTKLENLIGSQLDQATVDHLLVSSPQGKDYMYDVNLVQRLVEVFLLEGNCWISQSRIKKVASLMDLYLTEVAPDTHLKPCKFAALVMALPDSARESYDRIYQAIDMYLEVHADLSEEDKMRVCCTLNYQKLSAATLKQLEQDSKFPSRLVVEGFITQHSKLRSSPEGTNCFSNSVNAPLCDDTCNGNRNEKEDGMQIIPNARKEDNVSVDTDNVEAHLQGMKRRVTQLENFCRVMQSQLSNVMKTKLSNPANANATALPNL